MHVPLEARAHQQTSLDELARVTRDLRNALASVTRLKALGVEVTVTQALRGHAPPIPPLDTVGRVPVITRTAACRALMQARQASGWTAMLASATVDELARSFQQECAHLVPGSRVPLAALPDVRYPADQAEIPVGSSITFHALDVVEILGLEDALVPVHLALPVACRQAVLARLHAERADRFGWQEDLLARLPVGNPQQAASLAHLLGRYPAGALPQTTSLPPGPEVLYQGCRPWCGGAGRTVSCGGGCGWPSRSRSRRRFTRWLGRISASGTRSRTLPCGVPVDW
ncbi:hypothetical protein ACFSC4_09835 [Deinococcus malanensis]|uniref:hypothetical protein n=1 Tax=Deinococcus malanensis TaxID=1706855 RepID=UPI00362A9328